MHLDVECRSVVVLFPVELCSTKDERKTKNVTRKKKGQRFSSALFVQMLLALLSLSRKQRLQDQPIHLHSETLRRGRLPGVVEGRLWWRGQVVGRVRATLRQCDEAVPR
jgi:hypothetical protein